MEAGQTETKTQSIELAAQAFEAFCDDISGMFGVDMKCEPKGVSTETVKGLSKKYKKLAAVNFVKSKGTLNGVFNLVFDKGGIFTLAGIIVMLPKQKIIDDIKRGSEKEAEELTDTIKEVGNLLVGSWDRVFREEMQGHGHFLQSNTFIGNPWEKSQEILGISETEEFAYATFEIKIDEYPPFSCGVIYPEAVFITPPQPQEPQSAEEAKKEDSTASETKEKESAKEAVTAKEEKPAGEIKEEKPAEPVKPAKEEKPQPVENKEPAAGPVSETIQKMVSTAVESGKDAVTLKAIAKEIMQTNLVWAKGDESVQQAMEKMQQASVSYILIGEQQVAEGIASTYDIASAVSIYLKPAFVKMKRPTDDATLKIRLKWIMTKPVTTVTSDTSITAIMQKMTNTGLHCLPVTENGKIVGLITMFDVFKAILTTQKV